MLSKKQHMKGTVEVNTALGSGHVLVPFNAVSLMCSGFRVAMQVAIRRQSHVPSFCSVTNVQACMPGMFKLMAVPRLQDQLL